MKPSMLAVAHRGPLMRSTAIVGAYMHSSWSVFRNGLHKHTNICHILQQQQIAGLSTISPQPSSVAATSNFTPSSILTDQSSIPQASRSTHHPFSQPKSDSKQDTHYTSRSTSSTSSSAPQSSAVGLRHSSYSSDSDSGSGDDSPLATSDSTPHRYQKLTFTPEIDQDIIRLKSLGKSWPSIGSILAIPYRTLHRRYATVLDPRLHENWTEERLQQLDQLVAEGKPWLEIANHFGLNSDSCQAKWKTIVKPKDKLRNRQFDALQSKVLLQLVEEHGDQDWRLILRGFMTQMGGRDMAKVTSEQLKHQYLRLQRKPTRVWSMDDETTLIQHVLKHGTGKWDVISDKLKNHSAEQCREKWATMDMHVQPIKPKLWYKGEKANFWRLWTKLGSNWDAIAASLPKRTPKQVREFYEDSTAQFDKTDPAEYERMVSELANKFTTYVTLNWKKEDSEILWDVVEKCRKTSVSGRIMWKDVTKLMHLGLSMEQYKHHHYYLRTIRDGGLAGAWTEEETETLRRAVQELGREWKQICQLYLPNRNPKSLCHKYNTISHRGNYISLEEYDTLMAAIERQEKNFKKGNASTYNESQDGHDEFTPNWKDLAKSMPGWTEDQCKAAYETSFKQHLRTQWSASEDGKLMEAVMRLGRKNWAMIAHSLPGKHMWECRLRWSELKEPKSASDSIESRVNVLDDIASSRSS